MDTILNMLSPHNLGSTSFTFLIYQKLKLVIMVTVVAIHILPPELGNVYADMFAHQMHLK